MIPTQRYTGASSISDGTVTVVVILGGWSFLSSVCGGEDSLLYQIHSWNLPILTACLGKAYFGQKVFYFGL